MQADLQSKRNRILCGVLSEGELVTKKSAVYLMNANMEDDSDFVTVCLQVVDGTECRPYSSSVCVKGKCVRTGCDGIIGSKLQFDKCGICGGDSTGCVRVMGNFTKKR